VDGGDDEEGGWAVRGCCVGSWGRGKVGGTVLGEGMFINTHSE
jgi:hypothetical protein